MATAAAVAVTQPFKIPGKKMRREPRTCTLGDMFEKDEEGNPRIFNAELRCQSGLRYRIPEHQRHPSWKQEAKELLVDTVFRNYPMSGFVVSEHSDNGPLYYDFEDGQSRMSILQEYYNDGFAYKTENGQEVKFSQLPHSVKRQFENYKIYIEVMCDFEENAQFEVFERLQFGEPLKDKDLYWNRRDYTYVQRAMELIDTEQWKGTYMNTIGGITDKKRTALPSVVTLLYSIIQYHQIKSAESNVSKRKSMWKSFRAQAPKLNTTISVLDEARIELFLEYLNEIIDQVYENYPKQFRETVSTWNNLAKQTGMILHEWLETETLPVLGRDALMQSNQKKWVEMMVIERRSGDLMFKGKKTMWNGLDTSHKQNTDDAAIAARLQRVNAFYAAPGAVSSEYSIVFGGAEETE